MAANRFATMLHRKTNKITVILIYAVLEWVLILLLFLSSLFSYFIIKFAEFFGLKASCPWCTRIDHIIDPVNGNKNMHRDLLCEAHAKEVSSLGFCSIHRKLVESQDACEDCLSSMQEFEGLAKKFDCFSPVRNSWVSQKDEVVGENGEVSSKCSCCRLNLVCDKISSYVLLKTSSFDDLDCPEKENLIAEDGDCNFANHVVDGKLSDFLVDVSDAEKVCEEKSLEVIENGSDLKELGEDIRLKDSSVMIMKDKSVQVCEEDGFIEISHHHLEYFVDHSGQMLVQVELIDSMTEEQKSEENVNFECHDRGEDQECIPESVVNVEPNESLDVESQVGTEKNGSLLDVDTNELPTYAVLDSIEIEEDEKSLVVRAEDRLVNQEFESLRNFQLDQWPFVEASDVPELAGGEKEKHSDVCTDNAACEEVAEEDHENEADISIGTEIPDLDITDEIQTKESIHSEECSYEDHITASSTIHEVDKHELAGGEKEKHSDVCTDNAACEEVAEEDHENEADISIGTEIPDLDITDEIQTKESIHSEECSYEDHITASSTIHEVDKHVPMLELQTSSAISYPSFHLEPNEAEDDKVPDTPTSVDSFSQFHKKLHFLEKRDSVTEESLDGSVTSDLEGGDGVVSVESLKSTVKAERRALKALYAELEEERSASAVAASQTMAMINRLQEEKAAVQMEALQYQRMMEEQSEYDQEAVQLLNELMVKREKEKQELEKELEGCRKKLLDYEMKEKSRVSKSSRYGSNRSRSPSSSCSNSEDNDGMSADLNQDVKEVEGSYTIQEYGEENTPTAAVANLKESLADFEQERLSILEQLKVLEEKLVTLDDDNEQHFENVKIMEGDFNLENEYSPDVNGEANGHTDGLLNDTSNGKHHKQTRASVQKGKSLLPLFDAISDDNGDEAMNATGYGFESNGVHGSDERESQTMGTAELEEEVYHLYERLQALETDREFLKHCFSSLRKGDKGIYLLQEIVQHLRDLKNVELRARNLNDAII